MNTRNTIYDFFKKIIPWFDKVVENPVLHTLKLRYRYYLTRFTEVSDVDGVNMGLTLKGTKV